MALNGNPSSDRTAPKARWAASDGAPMFSVALGVAILLAPFVSPSPILVWLLFDRSSRPFDALGAPAAMLVLLFFHYGVAALLIYTVLRRVGAHRKFNFLAHGWELVLVGNGIVIVYCLADILAVWAGGEPEYSPLILFMPFVYVAAWLALISGLFQLWRNQAPRVADRDEST